MADTPTKVIVNCETGVTEVLPLSAQEIADLETARVAAEPLSAQEIADLETARVAAEDQRKAAEAEAAAKAAAKQAAQDKLKALGLTDLEIAAITGA